MGPGQRVSPYEGLQSMTIWAAEQYGEEATKGTLEVGKFADLVILDKDPLKVAPLAIKDIQVVETIKEGVTIYPVPTEGYPAIAHAPAEPGKTYSWHSHVCDRPMLHRLPTRNGLDHAPRQTGHDCCRPQP
ncbi:MAG: amidohydrolase family protein [Pirellulales bacterium]